MNKRIIRKKKNNLFELYGFKPKHFAQFNGVDYSKGNIAIQKNRQFKKLLAPRIQNHTLTIRRGRSPIIPDYKGSIHLCSENNSVKVGKATASISDPRYVVEAVIGLYFQYKSSK